MSNMHMYRHARITSMILAIARYEGARDLERPDLVLLAIAEWPDSTRKLPGVEAQALKHRRVLLLSQQLDRRLRCHSGRQRAGLS